MNRPISSASLAGMLRSCLRRRGRSDLVVSVLRRSAWALLTGVGAIFFVLLRVGTLRRVRSTSRLRPVLPPYPFTASTSSNVSSGIVPPALARRQYLRRRARRGLAVAVAETGSSDEGGERVVLPADVPPPG